MRGVFRSSRSAKVGGSTGALAQAPAPHWSPPCLPGGVSRQLGQGHPSPPGRRFPRNPRRCHLLSVVLDPDAQDGSPCGPGGQAQMTLWRIDGGGPGRGTNSGLHRPGFDLLARILVGLRIPRPWLSSIINRRAAVGAVRQLTGKEGQGHLYGPGIGRRGPIGSCRQRSRRGECRTGPTLNRGEFHLCGIHSTGGS